MEVMYELMSFGIPTADIPIDSEGVVDLKEHLKFLQRRKKQEALIRHGICGNVIVVPSRMDILHGKGPRIRLHVGNMKYGNVLEDNVEKYAQTKRLEKRAVCRSIVEILKK
jgi:hypothetical protein